MTPERFKRISTVLDQRQPDLTVVMEGVHKSHNLAAIARSADAVGIARLHAVRHHDYSVGAASLTRKAAMGAGRWIDVDRFEAIEPAYANLRQQNYTIVAATPGESAVDFHLVDYCKPTALVVGTELGGISADARDRADQLISIPMFGMAASLNVSVATALVLFEAQRQRHKKGMYAQSRLNPVERKRMLFEWCYPDLAVYCENRGLPYPSLDAQGQVIGDDLQLHNKATQ